MVQMQETGLILIVDDNPTNLSVLSKALTRAGLTIAVENDGESAIELVEYNPPDLILLDVMMPPGIDGFETCQRLKQNPANHDIPVIFMTSLSDPIDKVKGLSLGAVDYITKPFHQEEVLARVRLHLKLRNLTETLEEKNILLKQLTEEFSVRVPDRTAKLSQAVDDMQQAQIQLVQNEKMLALGELIAGVAHEINNPVGFISGNLIYTEQYARDMLDLLQLYQQNYPEPVPEIEQKIADIELDYLQEDMPEMILSMKAGIKRIKQISASLRTFSRSDTTSKVAVDIHEGIDSTLMILKSRLKANNERPAIEVIKEYGDLPPIECYPGQLNQVFMNILANAIDALNEGCEGYSFQDLKDRPNTIIIRTELLPDPARVAIGISDNGPGMPDEVKEQVFDYLFTTKPLGKGTGFGLSISRQIVEQRHAGTLTCTSSPGKGTEFAIALPLC